MKNSTNLAISLLLIPSIITIATIAILAILRKYDLALAGSESEIFFPVWVFSAIGVCWSYQLLIKSATFIRSRTHARKMRAIRRRLDDSNFLDSNLARPFFARTIRSWPLSAVFLKDTREGGLLLRKSLETLLAHPRILCDSDVQRALDHLIRRLCKRKEQDIDALKLAEACLRFARRERPDSSQFSLMLRHVPTMELLPLLPNVDGKAFIDHVRCVAYKVTECDLELLLKASLTLNYSYTMSSALQLLDLPGARNFLKQNTLNNGLSPEISHGTADEVIDLVLKWKPFLILGFKCDFAYCLARHLCQKSNCNQKQSVVADAEEILQIASFCKIEVHSIAFVGEVLKCMVMIEQRIPDGAIEFFGYDRVVSVLEYLMQQRSGLVELESRIRKNYHSLPSIYNRILMGDDHSNILQCIDDLVEFETIGKALPDFISKNPSHLEKVFSIAIRDRRVASVLVGHIILDKSVASGALLAKFPENFASEKASFYSILSHLESKETPAELRERLLTVLYVNLLSWAQSIPTSDIIKHMNSYDSRWRESIACQQLFANYRALLRNETGGIKLSSSQQALMLHMLPDPESIEQLLGKIIQIEKYDEYERVLLAVLQTSAEKLTNAQLERIQKASDRQFQVYIPPRALSSEELFSLSCDCDFIGGYAAMERAIEKAARGGYEKKSVRVESVCSACETELRKRNSLQSI